MAASGSRHRHGQETGVHHLAEGLQRARGRPRGSRRPPCRCSSRVLTTVAWSRQASSWRATRARTSTGPRAWRSAASHQRRRAARRRRSSTRRRDGGDELAAGGSPWSGRRPRRCAGSRSARPPRRGWSGSAPGCGRSAGSALSSRSRGKPSMVGISRSVTTTDGPLAQGGQRALGAVARLQHLEAGAAQGAGEDGPRHLAVVHHQDARGSRAPPFSQARTSVRARSRGGSATSAAPFSRATRGMPKTTELASSCTRVRPPALRRASSPSTPSDAHAGQQDAGHLARAARGAGEEQLVDRRPVAAPRRAAGVEAQHAAGLQPQMGAARGQPHGAPAQRLAVLGQPDVERELLVEPVGEAQLEARGDVLHDEEAHRRIRREVSTSSSRMAAGPPVEAPIATQRSSCGIGGQARPAASAARPPPAPRARARPGPRRRRAPSPAGSRRAAASSPCPPAWAAPPGRRAGSPRRRSASGCGWRARRGPRSASGAPP